MYDAQRVESRVHPRNLFAVWAGNVVFSETANGLAEIFARLGIPVSVSQGVQGGPPWESLHQGCVWVLIGLTLLPGIALTEEGTPPWSLPARFIVFQMEQLTSSWLTPIYMAALRLANAVWDFSLNNVAYWRSLGLRSHLLPLCVPAPHLLSASLTRSLGFVTGGHGTVDETYSQMVTDQLPMIDVLFYGAANHRRQEIQRALQAALGTPFGYSVVFRMDYGLFGAERDECIRRSRVVMNLHFYPQAALEVHRINYLLARGKCVLSEPSSDPSLDLAYQGAVVFAEGIAGLTNAAAELLSNDSYRQAKETAARQFAEDLPLQGERCLAAALSDLL